MAVVQKFVVDNHKRVVLWQGTPQRSDNQLLLAGNKQADFVDKAVVQLFEREHRDFVEGGVVDSLAEGLFVDKLGLSVDKPVFLEVVDNLGLELEAVVDSLAEGLFVDKLGLCFDKFEEVEQLVTLHCLFELDKLVFLEVVDSLAEGLFVDKLGLFVDKFEGVVQLVMLHYEFGLE